MVKELVTYVRYQRRKRGYTLQQFSDKTGLTPAYLSRLESDQYNNISLNACKALATGFDMPLLDFFIKCRVINSQTDLPEIGYYLREKYQLPEEAVEDVTLFFQFVLQKYQSQIKANRLAHQKYWEKQRP